MAKRKYVVTNEKDNEEYHVITYSFDDVNNWIINHLDLSKEWNVSNPIPIKMRG